MKRLTSLITCLILGAATTIALCWCIALTVHLYSRYTHTARLLDSATEGIGALYACRIDAFGSTLPTPRALNAAKETTRVSVTNSASPLRSPAGPSVYP